MPTKSVKKSEKVAAKNEKVSIKNETVSVSSKTVAANDDESDIIRIGEKERFTGRKIISFSSRSLKQAIKSFSKRADMKIASSGDYDLSVATDFSDAFENGSGIYFEKLGVAILGNDSSDQVNFMMDSDFASTNGMEVEPERYMYSFAPDESTLDYEWGVKEINPFRKGLHYNAKVAVLDTGIFFNHDDFRNLNITSNSFIPGQAVNDLHGHGTHCCGIAMVGLANGSSKRYGVTAYENLLVGKVLANNGKSSEDSVLAGIEWALENGAKVISLSLGAIPGETFSPAFERIGSRALKAGTIIIAAAGNESMRRYGVKQPVCHPANCPSIMAVGAVDERLAIADFSCTSANHEGGKIDLVAPGVKILSTWKDGGYKTLSGTSMATPFVAGIAAKLFDQFPSSDGFEIWAKLLQNVKPLDLPSVDAGAGLVQA